MGIGAALSGMTAGSGIFQSILSFWPPIAHRYQKMANSSDPQMIPAIGDLIELRYREQLNEFTFKRYCRDHGFSEEFADAFINSSIALLSGGDYMTLWRRGIITEGTRDKYLTQLHFDEAGIAYLEKATEYFPAAPDLVRFAVREVYSGEIAAEFGLFQDIPPEYLVEAEKAGLPEQMARLYWGAHWQLPSTGQGYDMLHRRIIDKDQLSTLLRALDVMPVWRDRLIQLSYNPITRVDVRRMYRLGVITEDEELNRRYEANGYSPDDAKLMTKFTKQYEGNETQGITRANLVKAYSIGLISRDDLKSYLDQLGYSENVVQFWVDMAEYEVAIGQVEAEANELVSQYQRGVKEIEEVRDELNKSDLPSTYINTIVSTALAKQSAKVRLPTKADLIDWLSKRLITEDYFVKRMKIIGYREEDILLYLAEQSFDHDTSKRKYLNINIYLRWWKNGLLSEELLREYTAGMNIAEADLEILMMEVQE